MHCAALQSELAVFNNLSTSALDPYVFAQIRTTTSVTSRSSKAAKQELSYRHTLPQSEDSCRPRPSSQKGRHTQVQTVTQSCTDKFLSKCWHPVRNAKPTIQRYTFRKQAETPVEAWLVNKISRESKNRCLASDTNQWFACPLVASCIGTGMVISELHRYDTFKKNCDI